VFITNIVVDSNVKLFVYQQGILTDMYKGIYCCLIIVDYMVSGEQEMLYH
jgi:hypothetical protein